jgi:hypothetical protein
MSMQDIALLAPTVPGMRRLLLAVVALVILSAAVGLVVLMTTGQFDTSNAEAIGWSRNRRAWGWVS